MPGATATVRSPSQRTCLSVVLAAGEGTRMRSSRAKVLHPIAGRPLIGHVLSTAQNMGGDVAVVVGPGHEAVVDEVRRTFPDAVTVVQAERRGTAHAVGMAREAIARGYDDIVVVFGDTPLITMKTLQRLRGLIAQGAAVGVVGFRTAFPTGYGRLIMDDGRLRAIREHKDASEKERAIDFCNGGLMAFAGDKMLSLIDAIGDANANREFYLTDAVEIANARGLSVMAIEATEDEVQGVNTQGQLAQAEAAIQDRLRAQAMEAGVSMVAPQTVFLAADTKLGRDVVIEPYVVFGLGVTVADGAVIRSFSHLEGAQIGEGARIGPYARLRPGAKIGPRVRIGNFVEVKEAEIGEGAQANHLTYIGDADVGAGTNIGAGTITCNYDGAKKHRTTIGARAFIGSNTALVAPVSVGDEAYVGSGSVITENVPQGSLALGRARQVVKEGWARRLRALAAVGKSGRKDV